MLYSIYVYCTLTTDDARYLPIRHTQRKKIFSWKLYRFGYWNELNSQNKTSGIICLFNKTVKLIAKLIVVYFYTNNAVLWFNQWKRWSRLWRRKRYGTEECHCCNFYYFITPNFRHYKYFCDGCFFCRIYEKGSKGLLTLRIIKTTKESFRTVSSYF